MITEGLLLTCLLQLLPPLSHYHNRPDISVNEEHTSRRHRRIVILFTIYPFKLFYNNLPSHLYYFYLPANIKCMRPVLDLMVTSCEFIQEQKAEHHITNARDVKSRHTCTANSTPQNLTKLK